MDTSAPRIQPAKGQLLGMENLEIVAYSNPEMFKEPLDVIVMAAGHLEPLGRGKIPLGRMLVILPDGPSQFLAAQINAAIAAAKAQQNGDVKPPGA